MVLGYGSPQEPNVESEGDDSKISPIVRVTQVLTKNPWVPGTEDREKRYSPSLKGLTHMPTQLSWLLWLLVGSKKVGG